MRHALLFILFLAACAPLAPRPAALPDRLGAECRLLAAAAVDMARAGTPAHAGLTEGCPGASARDERPLAEQMASLREATAAPLPPGVAARTTADTVFRRMITRGVPAPLAARLTATADFRLAAR